MNFIGPLFIVGLSRSGTKLIRDLLNQSSKIFIPDYESHFIPEILRLDGLSLEQIYLKLGKSSFVKKFPETKFPSFKTLETVTLIRNKSDLIEAVLKYYALENRSEKWDKNFIWGDKTPSNLRYLDLLYLHYPNSKFIHIIRDPRDRAISVNNTW